MADPRMEDVVNVIGRFYEAAHGAAPWRGALADLAALFDGSRAWLLHAAPGGVQGHTSVEDPGFASQEAQAAMREDPLRGLTQANPAGAVVRHSEMEDLDAFRRRALFGDWLRPRDVWFGLQAHLRVAAGEHVFVEVSHDRRRGDFADRDKRLLALLGPHILRAGEISAMVARARRAGEGPPAIVVDGGLRVVRADDGALAGLEACRGGLSIQAGTLRVAEPRSRERLRRLVGGAAGGGGGGMLAVGGEEAGGRWLVSVAPMAWPGVFGFRREGLAVLHLQPLEAPAARPLDEILVEMFDLQPSHARLAGALAKGLDLRRAAAERGLSYASARTYLDHVFRRTGTSRQGELVALMKGIEAADRRRLAAG